MIDRIRLAALAKTQLSTIKRKTGIEFYNSICRHALCLSLANKTIPPKEEFDLSGGIEMDWKVFSGGNEVLYLNLIVSRLLMDGEEVCERSVRWACSAHIHRGLAYLVSSERDVLREL